MNAGKYNKLISIFSKTITEDSDGFPINSESAVLTAHAAVKTTKGFTLISSGTDFEKAYTNFTIRFPKTTITRDMFVRYAGKEYSIEYLNNIDEKGIELEIQAKEVAK
jgi:SPP1 family predicted phage head-tail adaptor